MEDRDGSVKLSVNLCRDLGNFGGVWEKGCQGIDNPFGLSDLAACLIFVIRLYGAR